MPDLHGYAGYRGFLGLFFAWVKAEAATLFSAGVDFGLRKIFDALEATEGLVFSFFAMTKDSYG